MPSNSTLAEERLPQGDSPPTTGRTTPRYSGPQTYHQVNPVRKMRTKQIQIGKHNNKDIFKCLDVWNFIRDYCPTDVISVEALRERGKALATGLALDFDYEIDEVRDDTDEDDADDAEDDHRDDANESISCGSTYEETQYFNKCVTLCDEIKSQCIKDGLHCSNVLGTVSSGTLSAKTLGSDIQINGYFAKEATVAHNEIAAKNLETTDILVIFEYKQNNNSHVVLDNRLKVLSAAAHILLDDVGRNFMYAISIEGQWMTLWYFARDHSVRTTFNWMRDKPTMISVFLSFMYATEEDLGFDPRIHLLPASESPWLARRYIYELEDVTQTKRYYRTERLIVEPTDFPIVGRHTRVSKVVEVESESDYADYEDRPRKALKDTWMDAGSDTESKIQERLFADIQKFVESSKENQHALLNMWVFNGELSLDIAQYLSKGGKTASKDFRELFLCIKIESPGRPLRELHAEYLEVPDCDTFFHKADQSSKGSFKSTSRFASNTASRTPQPLDSDLASRHPAKQRTFLIFDDVCRSIDALPTVGATFVVLRRTVLALLLMFGASWVHRDISAGNVMGLWNPTSKEWESKLGDLEYAQPFTGEARKNESRAGTAYFMAAEVLRDEYLEPYILGEVPSLDEIVKRLKKGEPMVFPSKEIVVRNFYHDVESIFWIVYWVVTCRVGYRLSQDFVAAIFSPYTESNSRRDFTLTSPIQSDFVDALLPDLQPLATPLEVFRRSLWDNIAFRYQEPSQRSRFSHSHRIAFLVLDKICDPEQSWYSVPLQMSQSVYISIPQTQSTELNSQE